MTQRKTLRSAKPRGDRLDERIILATRLAAREIVISHPGVSRDEVSAKILAETESILLERIGSQASALSSVAPPGAVLGSPRVVPEGNDLRSVLHRYPDPENADSSFRDRVLALVQGTLAGLPRDITDVGTQREFE